MKSALQSWFVKQSFKALAVVARILKGLVKFAVVFSIATVACAVLWEEFVDGTLYNCTDAAFGYLSPECDWVHAWDGHPIVVVKKVIPDQSMADCDTIKEGWSNTRLYYLWSLLFAVSLMMSLGMAATSWSSKLKCMKGVLRKPLKQPTH
jgi:hypothetical protein